MSTKLLSLEGNLGVNPVVKLLATGKKVCNFSIATNKEWMDENNNKQKKTDWHNVECWDKDAEYCEQNLSKGVSHLIYFMFLELSFNGRLILEILLSEFHQKYNQTLPTFL